MWKGTTKYSPVASEVNRLRPRLASLQVVRILRDLSSIISRTNSNQPRLSKMTLLLDQHLSLVPCRQPHYPPTHVSDISNLFSMLLSNPSHTRSNGLWQALNSIRLQARRPSRRNGRVERPFQIRNRTRRLPLRPWTVGGARSGKQVSVRSSKWAM